MKVHDCLMGLMGRSCELEGINYFICYNELSLGRYNDDDGGDDPCILGLCRNSIWILVSNLIHCHTNNYIKYIINF